ncbi:hypothetical protein Q2K19_28885 [Micromonospora soli]|uniref:hypothetical protein n=1 Tax=Micromonospora sp. NBRC 110009 TaxID=3061627 RepID=UPI0026738F0B|nr:hypothetical protein [Micromonospora sp. NBRC 110009]WKT98139.1 hypothetical protein Q2K19_28885 [Micromonospora sp. NBRC 110009]
MPHDSEDRGPDSERQLGRGSRRDASAEEQLDDAMTDDDARTPDTSPTELEPTWRTLEASDGQAPAPPAPP